MMVVERFDEMDEMDKLEKFIKKAEQENFLLERLLEVEKMNRSDSNVGAEEKRDIINTQK